jgi:protein O-mannosyl-transferase
LAPGRRRTLLSCLGLAVAVLAAYQGTASHAFVDVDTRAYLTENPWVLRGLSWGGLRWALTTFHACNWHPLTWLSHMLDVELYGLRPAGHHLENVLLHATNACLVFLLLQALTGSFGRSLAVAGFFALHPLHVESVAWIVERKDLLAALFGLSSLLAWTSWTRKGGAFAYLAALAAFAAGLACKPMIVTWPCVLLLLDRWPLDRARLGARRLLVEKLPWFALAIASAVVTVRAQASGGAIRSLDTFPLPARLANAALAYATYLSKTFWPSNLSYP